MRFLLEMMWMQQYEDECYDITQAISRIEEELIASFMRNFSRHKAEETELGYNWSAWQVEMMKSLEEYSRENRKKYPKIFRKLNDRIDALIDMAREDGQGEEEERILKAIRNGIHIEKASESFTGSFFALNDRKIDALKKSVRNDLEKAEIATLRRVDDVYRKTIFDAQVYASTGAGTYEKAVDMAVKDFLSKGIDSVEYKNGTRHSISDYADMAIRTASKRAYFTGEGEKRNEYGEHLVIVNRRGAGDSHAGSSVCGHCAKWAGKVLIDDVWSGGSKADGDYPLMSQAIADGLYHPRCKDSHTTYFDDGFDAEYDKEKQAEEQKRIVEEHNAEEKVRYAERQVKKYDRLARYMIDDEDRKRCLSKKNELKSDIAKIKKYDIIESDIGDFKKKLLSDEDINKKYQLVLKNRFKNGSKDARRLILKYVPDDSVVDSMYDGIAHYDEDTRKISMNYMADLNNERGPGATWFHEHGHLIDYALGELSKDSDYEQNLRDDWENYIAKLMIVNNQTEREAERFVEHNLYDIRRHSAVSDIVNGLTLDKVRGCTGHSLDYWRKYGVESEAFAHMFEAQFDAIRYDEMKKMFPNALKLFEEMIRGKVK